MRVLLIAPPGGGKGTQATRIADRYGITHISSGELFRRHVAERTPEGEAITRYVARGDLVPDDLALQLLRAPIVAANRAGGFVLDGFPRTVGQAEAAYEIARDLGVTVHAVLSFELPHDVAFERLQGRGADGGRADDRDEIIRHRLEVYTDKTTELVDFYRSRGILHTIDASPPVDEVTEAVFAVLDDVDDTG